jgi:hypothetical protein
MPIDWTDIVPLALAALVGLHWLDHAMGLKND